MEFQAYTQNGRKEMSSWFFRLHHCYHYSRHLTLYRNADIKSIEFFEFTFFFDQTISRKRRSHRVVLIFGVGPFHPFIQWLFENRIASILSSLYAASRSLPRVTSCCLRSHRLVYTYFRCLASFTLGKFFSALQLKKVQSWFVMVFGSWSLVSPTCLLLKKKFKIIPSLNHWL